jgi:hypothetical protein
MTRAVYIDLGLTSAEEFWTQVVLPDFDEYMKSQSARHAFHAAASAWHLHEWIFDEQPKNTKLGEFRKDKLFKHCAELRWLRDYVEAGKHRVLTRRKEEDIKVKEGERDCPFVQTVPIPIGELGGMVSFTVKATSPATIFLKDGTPHPMPDVLTKVIDFWRREWFPSKP